MMSCTRTHACGLCTHHMHTCAASHPQVIPSNFQIRGMHTILRDRLTSKNDFV